MSTHSNRVDSNLSKIFDIELTTTDKPVEELAVIAIQKDIDSLEKQREYVKENMIALIERGKSALENLSSIAASTEKGRDYEILFGGINSLIAANKDLLDVEVVHKIKAPEAAGTSQNAEVITNQQIVFNGSTEELQRFLATQKPQNQ